MPKKCTKCGLNKQTTDFAENRNQCKACRSADRKEYRITYKKLSRQTMKVKLQHREDQRRYRAAHLFKTQAHDKVAYAIRTGVLIRSDVCQYPLCSITNIEGHHHDYNKALEVVWLCKRHHILADNVRRMKDKYLITQ